MQFRDLKQQYQVLKKDIDKAMVKVATDCNFISGAQVSEYSGLGDTTVRSFGNRYSGIKETAIPVLETNHIVP